MKVADDGPGERTRLPHVVMDRGSRVWKARKIVDLIGEDRFGSARRILEIGCGSGVIASSLAAMGAEGLTVDAVDVADNRIDTQGYAFHLVSGTALPFADGAFDIVVSNHVIEHVGSTADQLRHLGEIRRVLAPGGVAYLAVPNKWRLIEPHFRLPLLSWLGQSASDRYVRLARRGSHYDCAPLEFRQAMDMFAAAGFIARDVTLRALRATLRIERPGRAARMFDRFIPDGLLATGMRVMPTYVFLLRNRE